MHSFLLKKRAQTLLLFFSLSFFFLHHFRKSKQNKTSSADDAYWSRNTTTQKTAQNFSSAFCDQNFSSAFALKKHRPFLSTLIRQRKRKKWSRLPKVRALCSFLLHVELFFSLSFSLLFCAFFAFDIFFLFLLSCCVCVCVCVRVGVSSGLIFVSEFRFHFNHKMFSSHARMH